MCVEPASLYRMRVRAVARNRGIVMLEGASALLPLPHGNANIRECGRPRPGVGRAWPTAACLPVASPTSIC